MGAGKRNSSVKQNGVTQNGVVKNGQLPKETSGRMADPMAVTWSEKYDDQFQSVWSKLPKFVATFVATTAICIMGLGISGDWVHIFVHLSKQLGYDIFDNPGDSEGGILEKLKLKNLGEFWIGAVVFSYAIYFGIGGFLHWYFYVRQRDKAEEWKCQPEKFMSPELERHEIIFGSLNLLVNSSLSAVVACYISNGGYSTVYYNIFDYPIWWLLLQIPLVFIYQDYCTYLLHRLYHTPFLYKHFHKMHHKYKQPTAWSVTAIHPFESTHIQLTLMLPLITIPVHWAAFYTVVLYAYYHGIIDHSGINFKSFWWQPWQPDAIFHDNHHQYFHVNFAFNIYFWDILHGTYRRKDRVYTEDIFYGKGKALNEVSAEELKADIQERKSENPLAYRGNKLEYDLNEKDIKTTANGDSNQKAKKKGKAK